MTRLTMIEGNVSGRVLVRILFGTVFCMAGCVTTAGGENGSGTSTDQASFAAAGNYIDRNTHAPLVCRVGDRRPILRFPGATGTCDGEKFFAYVDRDAIWACVSRADITRELVGGMFDWDCEDRDGGAHRVQGAVGANAGDGTGWDEAFANTQCAGPYAISSTATECPLPNAWNTKTPDQRADALDTPVEEARYCAQLFARSAASSAENFAAAERLGNMHAKCMYRQADCLIGAQSCR